MFALATRKGDHPWRLNSTFAVFCGVMTPSSQPLCLKEMHRLPRSAAPKDRRTRFCTHEFLKPSGWAGGFQNPVSRGRGRFSGRTCLEKRQKSNSDANQREAALRIDLLPQVCRRLPQDDLQGGTDVGLQQVAAARRAVGTTDDHVRVDLRLAVLERDVADQREHLDLFPHRDLLV